MGEEGVDIAEKWFLDVCRFATSDADVEARLSPTVFAAYWPAMPNQLQVEGIMRRWFPMEVKTPHAIMPVDGSWFMLEPSPNETAPELFDRVAAAVESAMQDIPDKDRHSPLSRGWDGQVG